MNHLAAELRQSKTSLTAAALVALSFGCNREAGVDEHRASPQTPVGPEVAAMVGHSQIGIATVERAIKYSVGEPKLVLNKLIEARLYGSYALSGGLEQGRLRTTTRAVLARALLERIEEKAKTPAAATDAELKTMTERRWIEFDRPEAVTTCHAIVHAEGLESSAGWSLAKRLAEALRAFSVCEGFLARAREFPVAGAKITAERLPPVTPEGRTLILDAQGEPVDEGATFDEEFARSAHRIKTIGGQSGVVQTSFGWHVILLESRLPAKRVNLDERRERLTGDILRQRAQDMSAALLEASRQRVPISIERSAVETTARVQVGP